MTSCGERGADVSVASTGPATFDLANVAIDQTAAVATMSATAAKMIILRISCHPFQRDELMIALAHRAQLQGEGLHRGRFFAIARRYRARRRHWGRACNALGSGCDGSRGMHRPKISGARLTNVEAAGVASPAGFEPATCGLEIRCCYPTELRGRDGEAFTPRSPSSASAATPGFSRTARGAWGARVMPGLFSIRSFRSVRNWR